MSLSLFVFFLGFAVCASLTNSALSDSKPVYGLIFLFRWREDDPGKQEATCPEGLWFANQVSNCRRSE